MKVITSLLLCSQFIAPHVPHFAYSTFHKPKPYPSINIKNLTTQVAHLKNNSIAPIDNNSLIIIQAIKDLKSVPGFWPTLETYFNKKNQNEPHFAKGALFEIETAHRFRNTILGMNMYVRYQDLCRQFDLVAYHENGDNKIFGECKDINWEKANYYADTREKLKQQFLDQQKLVAMLNKLYRSKNEYQLFSKNRLCPAWKLWLDKQAIKYVET